MIKNYNELYNEIRMLQGNINRMCVTGDIEEAERMFVFARNRLEEIYKYNILKIKSVQ